MRRVTAFVLVVDSYPDCAASTCDVLSLHGIEAVAARSCAEALGVARADTPSAVVTSLFLRDGDGNDLAERLKATVHPAPPVIGLGESPRPHIPPFDHHFLKPADPRELVSVLRQYLPDTPVAV